MPETDPRENKGEKAEGSNVEEAWVERKQRKKKK